MKLVRTNQIIEGKKFHHILVNLYKIEGSEKIGDIAKFSTDFLNSSSFLSDYKADCTKGNKADNYLPFCFVPKKIELSDFKVSKDSVINNLQEELLKISNKDSDFYTDFKEVSETLSKSISQLELSSEYSLLNSNDYNLESPKITNHYKNAGFFITDYFFFGIIPTVDRNGFLTFEMAHE